MKIQLLRHATTLIEFQGKRLLVDPMLSPAGEMAAIPDVSNTSNNPLVELPVEASTLCDVDALAITHLHRDHFDEAAMQLLPKELPVFCQPADAGAISRAGFLNVQPVDQELEWNGVRITRTGGQHGTGKIGQKMGPVSGFIIKVTGEPALYIAGDTIWCSEVENALQVYNPQIIICYAGEARFASGDPITMNAEDIEQVCLAAPAARIVAVHMEAWNHCVLTRSALKSFLEEKELQERVIVPDDGEFMVF